MEAKTADEILEDLEEISMVSYETALKAMEIYSSQRLEEIKLLIEKYEGNLIFEAIAFSHDRKIEVDTDNRNYHTFISELKKLL
jgi:hypothetical protein